MGFSTGDSRGAVARKGGASSRRKSLRKSLHKSPPTSRLLASGAVLAGGAALLGIAVITPLAAMQLAVGSMKGHPVIRNDMPAGEWALVRPEPGAVDPATSAFSTVASLAQPDRGGRVLADARNDLSLEFASRFDPTRFDISAPMTVPAAGLAAGLAALGPPLKMEPAPTPATEALTVATVVPMPRIRPVVSAAEPPRGPESSAPRGGMQLASVSSTIVPADRDALAKLTRQVQPAAPERRRDDVTGSISPARIPDVPRARASESRTAVYDITSATVHLPNGEKLEAHSGLGPHFDNPRSVQVKNRGATPPNVYELTLRERPFHGVAALRMNPVGLESMYGRDGILAHSYLLGPRGESNGCVSFKDYGRFLQAFRRGEVTRLLVVGRLDGSPASAVARLRMKDRYAADGSSAQR